jgi:fructose-bisphosphate aldolase class I
MSKELADTIKAIACPGKGILAADESTSTIGKRFATIGLENSETNRKRYRSLIATTKNLGDFISGVILFEETLTQKAITGEKLVDVFTSQNIIPGIKVDKGLVSLNEKSGEQITQGLDGLRECLIEYKKQGARFAKWRNVYTIGDNTPSDYLVHLNAQALARYARL